MRCEIEVCKKAENTLFSIYSNVCREKDKILLLSSEAWISKVFGMERLSSRGHLSAYSYSLLMLS
jgi:hypothetical protein